MNLLAFTDLHADINLLKKLVARANKPDIDIVVTAGDFTFFNAGMSEVLRECNKIKKPFILIPGNHESYPQYLKALRKYSSLIDIHKKVHFIGEYAFVGYGLGGFAQSDPELRKFAQKIAPRVQGKKVILMVHGPPCNTKLDAIHGHFVGNKDINAAVKILKPLLLLCGHIHENAGKSDKIESTYCLNPGWEGKVITIQL